MQFKINKTERLYCAQNPIVPNTFHTKILSLSLAYKVQAKHIYIYRNNIMHGLRATVTRNLCARRAPFHTQLALHNFRPE